MSLAFLLCFFTGKGCFAAEVEAVNIESVLDPNAITITEIDVIFLYDETLVEEFPATKSRWYSMRRTLTQRWGDSMDVISVFIPQGFDSDTAILPGRKNEAVKVFVFGQHDDASVKPADVTHIRNVRVTIDDLGIIVSAQN
ncbi:MAG: hypothetical protein AB8B95_10645 [Pseudohongiellaceae bacterium]